MAPWTTPKTDWDPDDVLSDTALNNIENNTQFLYDERYVAGCFGYIAGSGLLLSSTDSFVMSKIGIFVPAGHRLILRRLQFWLDTTGRLQFELDGADDQSISWNNTKIDDTWQGTYDEALNTTLMSNGTVTDANGYIQIGVYNAGSAVNLTQPLSWAMKVFIEVIP